MRMADFLIDSHVFGVETNVYKQMRGKIRKSSVKELTGTKKLQTDGSFQKKRVN